MHILMLFELVTYAVVGLLNVASAIRSGLLVEVADGGPPALTGIVGWPSKRDVTKVDICKRDGTIPRKLPRDGIPSGSLLLSSPSLGRGDPTHKQGASGLNLFLHDAVKVLHGDFG